MSLGTGIEYPMLFSGRSTVGPVVGEIKEGLREIGETGKQAGADTSQGFSMSHREARRFIFSLQMGVFYFSMLQSAAARAENSTLTLANAQDRYNEAIREHGPHSKEAVRASRALTMAQRNLEVANQRATLSYVGLGLQTISFGIELARQVPQLLTWISTVWGAVTAHSALKGAMVAGAVGAAIGAGIGAGLAVAYTSNINVTGTKMEEFEAAQLERDRRERYDYRRHGNIG